MNKESQTRPNKKSANNMQPPDPREYPLARDSRLCGARRDPRENSDGRSMEKATTSGR
jgi:hypothetical protein